MKILVITQYFYPETFRVNSLCDELVKRGHDVTVLTNFPQYPQGKIYDGYGYNVPYETIYNGAKIKRMKVLPRGNTKIGLLLNCMTYVMCGNRWVNKCDEYFDIVYVLAMSPATVGLPAVKYKKKFKTTKIYYNVQDLWPESVEHILGLKIKFALDFIGYLVDIIYKNSDKILCSSEGFINSIEKRGVDKSKLIYWPQFCETPNWDELNKPLIYDDSFNIVFTGNIGFAQGLDLLIDAMELLKNENIKCYIVGDGRAKEFLQTKVNTLNLNSSVAFVGKVSEKEANEHVHFADLAYISLADNPALNLVVPAKMQTYLACGAPILGVVKGQSADIINSADCGAVASYSAEDIADKIKSLIASGNMSIFRKNARKYFVENYTIDIVIDRFEEIINESIAD